MRVAVLSLTRDRLDYTRHCFELLRDRAGCTFDHYVLDQASSDGTAEWLEAAYEPQVLVRSDENVGICRGLNMLLDGIDPDDYDVIVRFDNDCEVTTPNTLKIVCELADEFGVIAAPKVLGLMSPPPKVATHQAGGWLFDETTILGGIFMAVPAPLFHDYRYDETFPPFTGDEAICAWYRHRGGRCGYVRGLTVNHYETTVGQQSRYPDYHARKLAEMAA